MKLVLGCDHGGYKLKEGLKKTLLDLGVDFADYGTFDESSVDYPEIAFRVCAEITGGKFERGILICGTGIGMSMAANRMQGIRAALCGDVFSAKMSREHNDANVLCLGARVLGEGPVELIVKTWLDTGFTGGRHLRRIKLLDNAENN